MIWPVQDKGILRIIDANLNRTREGMRVCEDVVRFVLNDAASTKTLKAIRHDLVDIIASSKVSLPALYSSRDTGADVGADFSWLERKSDWQSIFFANMQRTKESMRVLEEFFKLFDNRTGKRFKDLRFRVYALEKKVTSRSKALSDSKHHRQAETIAC